MCHKGWVKAFLFTAVAVSGSTAHSQGPAAPPATGGAVYQPISEADAQNVLGQVVAAIDALDQRFAAAGASAEGWKTYLGWENFKARVRGQAKPDTAVLSEIYGKLTSGHEGLELKPFADLRTVVGDYLAIAAAIGSADMAAAVNARIEELNKQLKDLSSSAKSEDMQKISDNLLWLETAHQAPQLVQAARSRFEYPNFHVQVSGTLIGEAVGGPVNDVAPIDDVILRTTIHGMGRTVGHTSAKLVENPCVAMFEALMQGVNYSNNVGHHGPVCIYSTGVTCLAAGKRIWLDADGVHAAPATATADAHTTINNIVSIKGRKFIEKMAWRRAGKQLPRAEAIASQHAAAKLAPRVDAQAAAQFATANQQYQTKTKGPLTERRAFPRVLGFATTASTLEIRGVEALASQLAAPSAPPQLTQAAEITVRVHESTINNAAESIFTGMRLTDDMVQRTAVDLTGKVPEQLKPDQEPFTIIFPKEQLPRVQPISVTFADNGFVVTLRGREYITGDRHQPGMNITAAYKFVKSPTGFKAQRQGDLQIYGFGQQPGAPRALRQQAIWTALQRKFGKLFAAEIDLKGFQFQSGKLASAGQFAPAEIISQNGWLAVGYNRISKPAAVAAN